MYVEGPKQRSSSGGDGPEQGAWAQGEEEDIQREGDLVLSEHLRWAGVGRQWGVNYIQGDGANMQIHKGAGFSSESRVTNMERKKTKLNLTTLDWNLRYYHF